LSPQLSVTQLCAAKKKRRRRKDDPDTTSSTEEELSITSTATDLVDDDAFEGNSLLQASLSSNPTTSDLPDFDLSDDPDEPSSTSTGTTKPKKKKSTQAAFGDLETITPAMIGSSDSGSVKSIDELIADRSLEQRFQFDESEVDEEIPDFVQLAARSSSSKSSSSFDPSMIGGGAGTEQIGKKKQRQAERRANAIRAREEADASKSGGGGGLFNIPFFSPDKDQVSGIKILENSGTYTGTFYRCCRSILEENRIAVLSMVVSQMNCISNFVFGSPFYIVRRHFGSRMFSMGRYCNVDLMGTIPQLPVL
jgi:hypothetical protein